MLTSVDITKPINKEALAQFIENEIDAKAINYEDIPPIQEEWLEKIAMRKKIIKKQISIRLDSDIIDFLKKEDKHYQSHINTILRAYIETVKA